MYILYIYNIINKTVSCYTLLHIVIKCAHCLLFLEIPCSSLLNQNRFPFLPNSVSYYLIELNYIAKYKYKLRLLTSARCISLLSKACRLSLFRRVIKLLRLLNMYRRFNTPRTTFMLQLDSKVTKCSMLLYKCRENECSINNVVKWRTQRSSSFAYQVKNHI